MKWNISYYNQHVVKNVGYLEKSVKAKFVAIVDKMIEHGPNIGMPFTRSMGKGLFEIRAKGQSNIARGFYCTISRKTIVILHVYVKKTKATPMKELRLARARMNEVKGYGI